MPQKQEMKELRQLRLQLAEDAKRAGEQGDVDCQQAWITPQLWSQYMGVDGRRLYNSFTDEELLDLLRQCAATLGRIPSQKDIFCVYRSFIRRRFTNWPIALRAAGLKEPKIKKSNEKNG